MRFAIGVLAAAALAGCSGGPYSEQEKEVKAEVARYFAELNAQAGLRVQEAKQTKWDVDLPPTALVLSRYEWDLAGNVYRNVECPRGDCGAKIGTMASAGTELRCPSCNQELMTELTRIGRAQPMFEIKSGTNTPIVVLVRYVRESLAYDPNSMVSVSSKSEAAFPIKPYTDAAERGHGAYYAGGFYRVTTTALCTTGFVYKGGSLHQIDPESVKKMTKDPPEDVKVGSMKLGRWGAVEEALNPWLGKAPRAATAPKESPKNP